jgi:hypothetical protein
MQLAVAFMQTRNLLEGANQMADTTNGKTAGKNEKLGLIPMAKLGECVPPKVWEAHRKNLTALAEAKAAAAVSKQAVIAAFAKALKLSDPESLTFGSDAEKIVIVRRPKEKQASRRAVLRDLTV